MTQGGPAAFNVRSRVHEYGGGAYLVRGGIVYSCNDADQCLYRQERGGAPVPITETPKQPGGLRYADGSVDAARGRADADRLAGHDGRAQNRADDGAGTGASQDAIQHDTINTGTLS